MERHWDTSCTEAAWHQAAAEITFTPQADGRSTRVELWVDGRSVSGCWIVPQRIRLGRAVLRMDGIGGVGTEAEHRNRGFARRVLEAAIRRMEAGDAGLSMLYGIPNFYEKFGYVQAGPEHFVEILPGLTSDVPEGWTSRPASLGDMAALRRVYAKATAHAVGAAVRADHCYAWRALEQLLRQQRFDACAVAVSPHGEIRGYARTGEGHWAAEVLCRDHPEWWVLGEAMALDTGSAATVLNGCIPALGCAAGVWPRNVALAIPHDTALAEVASRAGHHLIRVEPASGGSMARILSLARLLQQAAPELQHRLSEAGVELRQPLVVSTETGSVALTSEEAGVVVRPCTPAELGEGALVWRTTASELVQRVLGAKASEPSDALPTAVREALTILFPQRCPHMYLPDRY